MDKLIDKFYNGSMSKFGFGTVGSMNPNTLNNKVMTPRPQQIKYNNTNRSLFNQNRSQNNINNNRYNGSQTLFNNPVPKTQYSIGLKVPTTSDPLLTKTVTIPNINQTDYNNRNMAENGLTKRFFKPEILKVHMLEQKIKEMEDKNKEDKKRMRQIIEGNVLNVNPSPKTQNIINIDTNDINNGNPQNLDQAMNNLRTQNDGLLDYNQKQVLRRQQIQRELTQAREKLKIDKISTYQSKDNSEEDEEDEEEEEDEESDKILKNNNNINEIDNNLMAIGMRPGPRNSLKTRTSKFQRGKEHLSPAEEEANQFIHNIPDHVALKLQNDNFRVRANLAQVKDGFRNIRNILEDKLDALQMAQKLNFEKVRFIIEQGGSKKMVAGLKKLIDGEDIDINNVEEDVPEYIKNLPNMIDEKLKAHEEQRKDELNQAKLEEQQMMDDEIGERFNVTNSEALKEFNPDNIKNDNIESNPWEVINTQTDYQYIPGRGVRTKTNRLSTIKNNLESKRNSQVDKNNNLNNLFNKRLITEEHENIIVNKIAEKIFRTLKDNNFITEMNLAALNNQAQQPIQEEKEPTKPPSKEPTVTNTYSSRDGTNERMSNLAEKKKSTIKSSTKTPKTSTKKRKKKKKSTTTEEDDEDEEEEEDDEEGEEEEEDDEDEEEEEDDEEGEEEDDDEEGEEEEDDENGEEGEEEEDDENEEEEDETSNKKKKKRKTKSNSVTESTQTKKKKKRSSDQSKSINKQKGSTDTRNTKKKKNKKRSTDEDESETKKYKNKKKRSVISSSELISSIGSMKKSKSKKKN